MRALSGGGFTKTQQFLNSACVLRLGAGEMNLLLCEFSNLTLRRTAPSLGFYHCIPRATIQTTNAASAIPISSRGIDANDSRGVSPAG